MIKKNLLSFFTTLQKYRIPIFYGLFAVIVLGIHRHMMSWLGLSHKTPFLFEALLILAAFNYVIGFKPIQDVFAALPRFYRVFAVSLVTLILLGHINNAGKDTFPFVGWTMYGKIRKTNPVYYEYRCKMEDGPARPFIPMAAKAIPAIGTYLIDDKIRRQINDIQKTKNTKKREKLMKQHRATLQAIVHKYNALYPQNRILSVVMTRCEVPLFDFRGDDSIKRKFMWEIEIREKI